MKTPTNDFLKNSAPILFGLLIVGGFLGELFTLLHYEFPAANKDPIASASKTLETLVIMAVGFWFGSNSSSKAKDETISEIAKQAPTIGTGSGALADTIPAKDVSVVAEGDVTVDSKPKESTVSKEMPLKEELNQS